MMFSRRTALASIASLQGAWFTRTAHAQHSRGNLEGWSVFRFGMTLEAAQNVAPDALVNEGNANNIYGYFFNTQVMDVPTTALLYFFPVSGSLHLGRILLRLSITGEKSGDKYSSIISDLIKKYGAPSEERTGPGSGGHDRIYIFKFDNEMQIYTSAHLTNLGDAVHAADIDVEYGPTPLPSKPTSQSQF